MSDAQTLAICRQLLFIQHEEEALVELDPAAPVPDSPLLENAPDTRQHRDTKRR